jgi:hypothetical protein
MVAIGIGLPGDVRRIRGKIYIKTLNRSASMKEYHDFGCLSRGNLGWFYVAPA